MNIETIIPIVLILSVVYWLWRTTVAINSRGLLVQEVDDYLGSNTNPEILKMLVYHSFDDCLDHFLPLKIAVFFTLNSHQKSRRIVSTLENKLGENEVKKALSLSSRLIDANIKLSPLLTILSGLIIAIMFVIKATVSKSTRGPISSLEVRIEAAYLQAVN